MKFLIDTCVISELASKSPNSNVTDWIDDQELKNLYLSVLTIGEIRRGIEKLQNQSRKEYLLNWLEDELLKNFRSQLIELDLITMLTWGELTGRLDKTGKPLSAIDSLIAASALRHDCVLVTRNVSDFKHSDVELLNPWD